MLNLPEMMFSPWFIDFAWSAKTDSGIDLSIEGMRSQQFSVGMFFFLLFGILLFAVVVFGLLFGNKAHKTMRIGEMVMFGAIILGLVAAVVIASLQMLQGYLI